MMIKKIIFISVFIGAIIVSWLFLNKNSDENTFYEVSTSNEIQNSENYSEQIESKPHCLNPPLDRFKERSIKKPFGIYITPENSPIKPERFSGYHTGLDLEILDDEKTKKVEVTSICSGKVKLKSYVNGYGGVLVQSCNLQESEAVIIYGHLSLASIKKDYGEEIDQGRSIGILGEPEKGETDGERKHLHLAIYKGKIVNLLGYVADDSELSNWADPASLICQN